MIEPCCAHRGLDHASSRPSPLAGASCTMPGCRCRGWKTRVGKRQTGIPERIRALRAEGLSNAEIRERLGVSVSAVTDALRAVRTRAEAKAGAAPRRAKRAAVSDCLSGFGL